MLHVLALLICIVFSFSALAKDIKIDMLNKLGKERNIYSTKIAYIDINDTVFWKAKSKGHNVEFIMKNGVPRGVVKFKSRLSKDAQFRFKIPGIYAYWCTPHKGLGMIGFIVVGKNKNNLDSIKKVRFFGKSKKMAAKLIRELEN